MRCNSCPACQNIYGNYELPEYGCVIFGDDSDEISCNSRGEDGCKYRLSQINKILYEIHDALRENLERYDDELSEWDWDDRDSENVF